MLNLSDRPTDDTALKGSVVHKRMAAAFAVLWAVALLATNATRLPKADDVDPRDVYAALASTNFKHLCAERRIYFRAPNRPPLLQPPACDGGAAKAKSLTVSGYRPPYAIYFREGVSDEDARLVAADFSASVKNEVGKRRTVFVLKGLAWWAISAAICLAFTALIIPRLRIERWPIQRLVLLWFGSASALCAWIAVFPGYVGGDVVSFVDNPTWIPQQYRSLKDYAFALAPLTLMAVAGIGTSVFVQRHRASDVSLPRGDKQWLIVWAATILIALIWWDGKSRAASATASASPDLRPYVSAGYIRSGSEGAYNITYDAALDGAHRAELTKRLFGSVILLAAFGVWYFGRRE